MSEESKETELVELIHNGRTTRVYPEIAEFFKIRDAAQTEWGLAVAKAEAEHHRIRDAAYIAHLEAGGTRHNFSDAVSRESQRAVQSARRATEEKYYDYIDGSRFKNYPRERQARGNPSSYEWLYENTKSPLVKWILDNCLNEERNALIILRHLPNQPEELWTLAKDDYDMCHVFDSFYEKAEAAGLLAELTGGKQLPGQRELAAMRNYIRRTWGSNYVPNFMERMKPVLKAFEEDYDQRLATAKAEWQKLDEARAENATFNRSQAQKARYERERQVTAAKALVEEDAPDSVEAETLRPLTRFA
jgi:hypothetical protein